MSSTLWTLSVACLTAVVTSLVLGLFITPRMEARKNRVGSAHALRDAFNTHMGQIVSACLLLQHFPAPPGDDLSFTPVMRERLTGERARWLQQLDDATLWLIDNATAYAGGWPTARLIRFATDYAGHARLVVLSEREENTKVELLVALTAPVQRQLFGWIWARARHALADHQTFADVCSSISGEPSTP